MKEKLIDYEDYSDIGIDKDKIYLEDEVYERIKEERKFKQEQGI